MDFRLLKNKKQVFLDFFSLLFFLLGFLPTGVYLFLTQYVRFLADDFRTAGILSRFGFWESQVYWYLNWTGSYFYTFLISLIELAGFSSAQWVSFLTLSAWLLLLFFACCFLFKWLGISISNIWTAIFVVVIVFCTIRSFKGYTQLLFWLTGIVAYQFKILIFLSIVIYFFIKFGLSQKRQLASYVYWMVGITFFITGGIGETWAMIQLGIFILALLIYLWVNKNGTDSSLFKVLIIGFLTSFLSLMILVASPGNAIRSHQMEEITLIKVIHYLNISFFDVSKFLLKWFQEHSLLFGLITLTGFLCGFYLWQTNRINKAEEKKLLLIGLIIFCSAYLLMWAGFLPAFVAFGKRPPERALFTSLFILLWAYGLLMVIVGSILRLKIKEGIHFYLSSVLMLALGIVMVLSPLQTALVQIKLIPVYQLYAQTWDERDAYLREASQKGELDVVVPSLRRNPAFAEIKDTIWIIGDIEETPNNWKNKDMAFYYRLKSITGQK